MTSGEGASGNGKIGGGDKMFQEAIMDELAKLSRRLDDMEVRSQDESRSRSRNRSRAQRERTRPARIRLFADEEREELINTTTPRRTYDSNINAIKMSIPPFKGRNDVEAYLEWERKVDLIFECHDYSEEKKVKLATVEFCDYALIWWVELVKTR